MRKKDKFTDKGRDLIAEAILISDKTSANLKNTAIDYFLDKSKHIKTLTDAKVSLENKIKHYKDEHDKAKRNHSNHGNLHYVATMARYSLKIKMASNTLADINEELENLLG